MVIDLLQNIFPCNILFLILFLLCTLQCTIFSELYDTLNLSSQYCYMYIKKAIRQSLTCFKLSLFYLIAIVCSIFILKIAMKVGLYDFKSAGRFVNRCQWLHNDCGLSVTSVFSQWRRVLSPAFFT